MNTPDRIRRRSDDRDMREVTSVGPSDGPELEPDVPAFGMYGAGDFPPSKDLDVRRAPNRESRFESVRYTNVMDNFVIPSKPPHVFLRIDTRRVGITLSLFRDDGRLGGHQPALIRSLTVILDRHIGRSQSIWIVSKTAQRGFRDAVYGERSVRVRADRDGLHDTTGRSGMCGAVDHCICPR
jgi:hypothetical protein